MSGSGEQFDFKDGEIPLAVTPASAREWKGTASRSLADLHLKDGDMLVYRAVAADTRPGDGSASSDAFFIEISTLGVAAGDAFTLPEEETRYALSQQMLIIKTERLHQRRATLPPPELNEEALNLAVEQRMIRAEFVFMLGGEVEDEEVEAEQSTELQAGRLQNRGQRDVRDATIAMSQAEKLLTGAEHRAAPWLPSAPPSTALQRAFSRERYILRALASAASLDPARRLTGNLSEAADWRRRSTTPANRRTALLRDLSAASGAWRRLLRDTQRCQSCSPGRRFAIDHDPRRFAAPGSDRAAAGRPPPRLRRGRGRASLAAAAAPRPPGPRAHPAEPPLRLAPMSRRR